MLDAIKLCLLPRDTVLKNEKAFMDSIWDYLLISPTELDVSALDGIPMDADTILKQAAAFQLDREGVVDDALAADEAPAPAECGECGRDDKSDHVCDPEWSVDDIEEPNVYPYKMCVFCSERSSCGNYNSDKKWVCESCAAHKVEKSYAHSTSLGYSQHGVNPSYDKASSASQRHFRYLYKVSAKARTQECHKCFRCDEIAAPGYRLGKYYTYCCSDCVIPLSEEMDVWSWPSKE